MNEMLLVPPIPEAKQAQRRVKPLFQQAQLLKSLPDHEMFYQKTPYVLQKPREALLPAGAEPVSRQPLRTAQLCSCETLQK